jgi:hypothetical protein
MHQPTIRTRPDNQHEQSIATVGPSATAAGLHERARRGAVAVEAAVVLTLVVPMMLGVWQVGRMVEMSRILQDAAGEGARIAAGG